MRSAVLILILLMFFPYFPVSRSCAVVLPAELTLKDSPRPIRVDGKLKDWPESRVVLMDREDFVAEGRGFWQGPADGSAKVYLTYDAEYLYLAAVVMQDHPPVNTRDGAELWNGDCIELMVSSRQGPLDPFFSTGDSHIGLAPGNGAAHPRGWCFHRDREVQGLRISSRKTNTGYLLEAAVPLAAFGGLEVGPDRTARINVAVGFAGPVSGDRLFAIDLTGRARSWRDPGSWPTVRFTGAAKASIPWVEPWDSQVDRVLEGTKESTLLTVGDVTGRVVDPAGRGIPGFRVRTWPRSAEDLTAADGTFRLKKAKVYDRSVVTASRDGFFTVLAPVRKGAPGPELTAAPQPSGAGPGGFHGSLERLTPGVFVDDPGCALLLDCPSEPTGWAGLKGILSGDRRVILRLDAGSLGPVEAADRVRSCRRETSGKIRDWVLSFAGKGRVVPDPYDLVNQYRVYYNALKTADPSIHVMGPDLPLDPPFDAWLTPFLRYDGDIIDALALRFDPDSLRPRPLPEVRWELGKALRQVQYAVGALAGRRVPLVLAGGQAADGPSGEDGKRRPALWAAMLVGVASQEGALYAFPSIPQETPLFVGFLDACRNLRGTPVACGSLISGIEVHAVRDEKEPGACRIVVMNIGARDDRTLRISLGGKSGDLWVDRGLGKRIEADLPGYGILRLTLDAKGNVTERKTYSSPRVK